MISVLVFTKVTATITTMRFCDQLTEPDVRLVKTRLDDFVPREVFDAHVHIFHSRHFAEGKRPEFIPADTAFGLRQFNEAMSRWLPGRVVRGLVFGYPSPGNDRAGENAFVAGEVAGSGSRALALLAPEDDPSRARQLIAQHRFVGIKPYRLYAPVADSAQATIEEFAPEWMWETCNEMDGVLMLHIVRSLSIADENNLNSLRRLCRKYPRCRVVLAHVARSFNYRNALAGLASLADLDNVVVDTAGVTETEAMRAALEILGPRRVLYGSDYPISNLRGKCFTMGDGFTWVYADDLPAKAVTPFENFTLVGIESLLCLREACENAGANDGDLRDIFRDNALRLLSPHLETKDVPPAPTGPELWARAQQRIACGTGLLSKRAVSFDPATWPQYYSRCEGAYIWDTNNRRYLDFTGGVGAILLGYSDPDVNAAVKRRVNLGSYCTLVSPDEVELAELLLGLHPWAQRLRYARGGGEALAQAVRIARAATGRSGIAFCGYHGWSDWYLAANLGETNALDGHLLPGLQPLGVPRELAGTAIPFRYNDYASFEAALKNKPAAVLMEPMRAELPRDGFLDKVAAACRAAGAVFMVDEVTSGWRFGFPGACARFGVQPDVVVYAKAISNGFPCAAIVGRAEVMDAANASFISSSYWTDGVGPAAALACVRKMQRVSAQQHVWTLGEKLQSGLRQIAAEHPSLRMKIGGMPAAPSLAFELGAAKTLYIRKMVQRGILASGQYYVMWPHSTEMVDTLLAALSEVCGELTALHDAGRLQAEAGSATGQSGFARLA
ncbi:MAG: aminotransferase class III-fold pyridoxal phosphate-dependent enzyme [Verrucomicrobia bacterium]|nr:aminotransferase class III-fold pyridoxal phosphate-dependent enzyme [Verrucomicrobiota bacterium]